MEKCKRQEKKDGGQSKSQSRGGDQIKALNDPVRGSAPDQAQEKVPGDPGDGQKIDNFDQYQRSFPLIRKSTSDTFLTIEYPAGILTVSG